MAVAKLPSAIQQYWALIQASAKRWNVDPLQLAGIMWRESNAGLALTPPGPSGTGDWTPRNGAMPPDGLGWGRGLMQIDYRAHNDWVTTNNWQDPAINIDKAASILAANRSFFLNKGLLGSALDDAAIAAYNAGPTAVWNALQTGRTPSSVTTGGNYASNVLNFISMLA